MASGSKYSDKDREEALAMLVIDGVSAVARKTGIPKATLSQWKNGKVKCTEQSAKNYEQLRTEKKKEFVENAWKSIRLANELIERQLQRALKQEAEINNILDTALEEIADSDMSETAKKTARTTLYKRIEALKIEDINKLSTTMGTLYDKQALANNESTVNTNEKIEIVFSIPRPPKKCK